MRGALLIRKKVAASIDTPLAIVDVALELGIFVSFLDLSSAEGMWCREKRAVVLTALRPAGRRAFTCAHEIGHAFFGHGTHADELSNSFALRENSPEERLADLLAGYLLMPHYAVAAAMKERGWNPDELSSRQAFVIANLFGVTYGALVHHARFTLNLINAQTYARLSDVPPKRIRKELCPEVETKSLLVVDKLWSGRPIDLEVGDVVMLPKCSDIQGDLLEELATPERRYRLARARSAGVGQIRGIPPGHSTLLRISDAQFCGFGMYRYPTHTNVYGSSAGNN